MSEPLFTATGDATEHTPPFTVEGYEDGSMRFIFGGPAPMTVTLPLPHLLAVYAAVDQMWRHADGQRPEPKAAEAVRPESGGSGV